MPNTRSERTYATLGTLNSTGEERVGVGGVAFKKNRTISKEERTALAVNVLAGLGSDIGALPEICTILKCAGFAKLGDLAVRAVRDNDLAVLQFVVRCSPGAIGNEVWRAAIEENCVFHADVGGIMRWLCSAKLETLAAAFPDDAVRDETTPSLTTTSTFGAVVESPEVATNAIPWAMLAASRNVSVAHYFIDHCKKGKININWAALVHASAAAGLGNLEMLRYLKSEGVSYASCIFAQAKKSNNIPVLEWLAAQRPDPEFSPGPPVYVTPPSCSVMGPGWGSANNLVWAINTPLAQYQWGWGHDALFAAVEALSQPLLESVLADLANCKMRVAGILQAAHEAGMTDLACTMFDNETDRMVQTPDELENVLGWAEIKKRGYYTASHCLSGSCVSDLSFIVPLRTGLCITCEPGVHYALVECSTLSVDVINIVMEYVIAA